MSYYRGGKVTHRTKIPQLKWQHSIINPKKANSPFFSITLKLLRQYFRFSKFLLH